MKAILTRRSGVAAIVDVYRCYPGMPTEVLEAEILKMFNSFEGVKSNPFISVKIIGKRKPLRAKGKNNFRKMA